MYIKDTWHFIDSIEYEYKYAGNYGAKGEKRKPKRKPTPEEIQKVNQYNRSKRVRRIIMANFTYGDYWTTLTYPKGEAKSITEVSADLKTFIVKLRRAYKRIDIPLKYIYRIEIGSRGGIHVHILLNRIPDLDQLVGDKWDHGHANIELVTDDPDTPDRLSEYIVKPPTEQQMKMINSIGDGDTSKLIRYSCSRNLDRPEPERQKVGRKTMRRIFTSLLKPTEGYFIVKSSIHKGFNPFTGTSFFRYREKRIEIDDWWRERYLLRKYKERISPIKLCECPRCHQLTIDHFACDCEREKRIRKRGKHGGD